MHRYIWLLAIVLISAGPAAAWRPQGLDRDSPVEIFKSVGLTAQEISAVETGSSVAKVLPWGGPSEVYVFGAVHIDQPYDVYLKTVRDIARLTSAPGYLAVGEVHTNASDADLSGLVLDADDVKALKNCREGSCDVQLPAGTISAFRERIDWSRADVEDQVNALARQMTVQLVHSYQQGGNLALGEYRDKKNPARVADQFQTMLQRASVLPDVLPELRRYLLEYPNASLPAADSFFYWEKVDFGLKPTIRINHAVIYRGRSREHDFAAVALKQLYATHYFHTALDVSVCVQDGSPARRSFYLLTLKASQQEGLTGLRGSLLRKVVVDRTRTSLERALASIKKTLETH